MAHLRHLAAALGRQSDYSFDKSFKRGPAARAVTKRMSRVVTKKARRAFKRESARTAADER